MLKINKYYSYNLRKLPKGCEYCVRGEKLVVFLTGLCPRKCYFCPISDKKYGFDVTYANERKVASIKDVIQEAKMMNAKGAGITGGDPLCRIDKAIGYIKKLKKTFGKTFHIHLYTSLNLVSLKNLKNLYQSGLDEIRFHLDLDSSKNWEKLNFARKFSWDIGVEIPLIPNKKNETKKVIDFLSGKIDFLNLNELEIADNKLSSLGRMGFKTKDRLSYAVSGSSEMGKKMIEYIRKKKFMFSIHLCTAKLKDAIQLTNRIKREGRYVKKKFDIIDDEGILTRGALYLKELAPGYGYRDKLEVTDKKEMIIKLKQIFKIIKKRLNIEHDYIFLDKEKPRILTSKYIAMKYKNIFIELGLIPAIVVEYPTADQLEIEVEFLN